MDFSVKTLNKMEKDLTSTLNHVLKSTKTQSVEELNHAILMKLNKDTLVNFVENLSKLMKNNIELCKSAAGTIDEMKSEQIDSQKTLIELQQTQLQSVQETMKTEMKSWSDIVKKNCEPKVTSMNNFKKAVKSVVEDNVRSNNFIVYGAEEYENDGPLPDKVHQIFNEIRQHPWPEVLAACRVGPVKSDSGSPAARPIKVTLASSELVKQVLSKARHLKESTEAYTKMYLAPDRSKEERTIHQKLVSEMKQMISKEQNKYHFIRDGKIVSVDKT